MASDRISSSLHRTARNPVLKRDAVEKLHRDKHLFVLVVDFINRADVGMIQRGGGLGFTLEAAKGLWVFGNLIRKEFEGHEAVEFHVLGFVDDAHPAAAQLLDDAVVRDGLPDH